MKKVLLASIASLAMLLFQGNVVQAQQETPAPDNGQVIIVQRVTLDDGTVTVKKKSIEKGQDVQNYLENLEQVEGKSIITIMTDGESDNLNTEGETILFFRKGKGEKESFHFKHDREVRKHLDELRINMSVPSGSSVDENKPYLGIYPSQVEKGILVTGVVEGSGAKAAGLQAEDILTAINGKPILTQRGLSEVLAQHQPGDQVTIAYLRNGNSQETKAVLSSKPNNRQVHTFHYETKQAERDPCKVFYGVYVGTYGDGQEGVGVAGIVKDGEWPAELAGLQKGDRIIAIDAIPVNTHRELVVERDKHKPGEAFTFTILRDGYPIDIDSRFKACPQEANPAAVEETPPVEALPELPPIPTINQLELENLEAFPNPTFGQLNVKFTGEAVPTVVTITDTNGKMVHQENLTRFDGIYNRNLDLSKGAPGMLTLTIRQGNKLTTLPIVLLNRA